MRNPKMETSQQTRERACTKSRRGGGRGDKRRRGKDEKGEVRDGGRRRRVKEEIIEGQKKSKGRKGGDVKERMRIEKLKGKTLGWRFRIVHTPGKSMPGTDAL